MVREIKLSDYVSTFIADHGVKTVFAISGGASLHLIHSINDNKRLSYVCTHHEQGAAMAADGYSRSSSNIGVVISTSGPGATNLITGICCSYYDSVPLIVLTGQVSTFRMTGSLGVRQIGFQETPITKIVEPITKYSTQILDPKKIKFELEKALFYAFNERPGPVLIDIPDNLQRELIDPRRLEGFRHKIQLRPKNKFFATKEVKNVFFDILKDSKRPVLIAGWGIHLSQTEKEFLDFAEFLGIPIALTWGGSDLINHDHPLYIGTFGTHGMRHANMAVQNSDLIISLGSRLDTKSTGSPITTFAREAKKIMIDIDPYELDKFSHFGLKMDLLIQEDLKVFFKAIKNKKYKINTVDFDNWKLRIKKWKDDLPKINKEISNPLTLEPYSAFSTLSKCLPLNSHIYIDTGCSIAWAMQSLELKNSQRVFHDFNNTAMGWALPASIGAYFTKTADHIICIIGDGSLMMTVQELSTIKHHNIPLKIILINNSGYSMIKQTQDQWLSSKYIASSNTGGLSFPNYKILADSFDLNYFEAKEIKDLQTSFKRLFNSKKGGLLNMIISPDARVSPQVRFGRPNEDMEPLLPRKIFIENMIVKPLPCSEDS